MLFLGLRRKIRDRIIGNYKKSNYVLVSDTTLRDGEQMPEATLFPYEKLEIAKALEELGIDSIEAGFPGSCQSEIEGIKLIAENIKKPRIIAFCRAKEDDFDKASEALTKARFDKKGVTISLASSPEHRQYKLKKSKGEIIDMAVNAVRYASKYFDAVSFGPEDASRTELEFLIELYDAAIDAGAATIGFSDTVGILNPKETEQYITEIHHKVKNINKALLAIHFHNDLGMAVANSLAAIDTGYVDIFQGTIGGVGERTGNASIEEVVMALKIKDYKRKTKIKTEKLKPTADLVFKYMNLPVSPWKPVIGKNVFRTEAGIHQDGLLKKTETYEIFPPEAVGAAGRELVIGKHSGRHALKVKLESLNFDCSDEELERIFVDFKEWFNIYKKISDEELISTANKKLENKNVQDKRAE